MKPLKPLTEVYKIHESFFCFNRGKNGSRFLFILAAMKCSFFGGGHRWFCSKEASSNFELGRGYRKMKAEQEMEHHVAPPPGLNLTFLTAEKKNLF